MSDTLLKSLEVKKLLRKRTTRGRQLDLGFGKATVLPYGVFVVDSHNGRVRITTYLIDSSGDPQTIKAEYLPKIIHDKEADLNSYFGTEEAPPLGKSFGQVVAAISRV